MLELNNGGKRREGTEGRNHGKKATTTATTATTVETSIDDLDRRSIDKITACTKIDCKI